jgi:hypothetical protein
MGLGSKLRRAVRQLHFARALRRAQHAPEVGPVRAEGIVFSKDRPLQLFALLSSYAELVRDPPPLHVLYRASDEAYRTAYEEALRASPAPLGEVILEGSFREDLLALLDGIEAQRVFFLVDDIVFVREVDLAPLVRLDPSRFVPSLRLGAHLSRSYTRGREQPLPPFQDGILDDPDLLCWRWRDGALDWGYPLSVDGHLFSTAEMRVLARTVGFSAPNSFEGALQDHLGRFADRLGVCHREARILNVPCNKVQGEFPNRFGAIDAATLLEVWQSGRRLDHRRLYGIVNESAHQEVELAFVSRRESGAARGA